MTLTAIQDQAARILAADTAYKGGVLDAFLAASLKAAKDGEGIAGIAKFFGVSLRDGAEFTLEMVAPAAYPSPAAADGITRDDVEFAKYCTGVAEAIFEGAIAVCA